MAIPIAIPVASIGQDRVEMAGWLKQVGEPVRAGDPVLQVETDKALVDVLAPASGTLLATLVVEGPVDVQQVVGWIGAPGEQVPSHDDSPDTVRGEPARALTTSSSAAPLDTGEKAVDHQRGTAATPAARRRARELGMNLRLVHGSGPAGRVTEADVERQALRGADED